MKKAFRTDVVRSITHSLSRFFAILMIVALGTGFYTGLRSTSPDMKLTVDDYCDEGRMMDLHGVSTMGFTDEDVAAIRATEGISSVMAGYTVDAISRLDGKDRVIRIHSLPANLSEDNEDYLNRPVVVKGRLPEKSGECVVSKDNLFDSEDVIGSTITLTDKDGSLGDQIKTKEYTIVGIVDSSYYLSFSLGSTELGSGNLDYYMYIPETDFSQPAYTDLFVTVIGAADLSAFSDDYEELVSQASDRLEELADVRTPLRLEGIRAEAQQELDDARQEYEDAKKEADDKLADAEQTLRDAEQEVEDSEQRLADAKQTLQDGEAAWKDGIAEYEDGIASLKEEKEKAEKDLSDAQKQIDDKRTELEDTQTELQASKKELDRGAAQIEQTRLALAQMDLQHQDLIDQLDQAEEDGDQALIDSLAAQIEQLTKTMQPMQLAVDSYDDNLQRVTSGLSAVKDGFAQLDEQQKLLDQSKQEAEDTFTEAEEKLEKAKKQLDKSRTDLDNGYVELQENSQKLTDAKQEIEDGWEEYEAQKQEAEEELDDAKQKLDDGQKELDELEKPTWYWLNRDTNVGFASMSEDSERIASLSTVFPIIFFLVAALVALTTMTRMVEEERTLIGTYKALGYRSRTIMAKYLIYALLATLIGCVLGILVCNSLIPVVCWNSYRIMYTAPDIQMPLNWGYAAAGCAASLLCTLGATFLSCFSILRESPSALMQPKAPKAGKRILLERITPVWKRLTFIHKVTARNLFRYKKRLFMTIIGIAGCTALLLTGFGIKDSVSAVVGLQYSEIFHYDATIQIQSEEEFGETGKAVLEDSKNFSDYLVTDTKLIDITAGEKTQSGYLVVPEQTGRISDFITLRSRIGGKEIPFDKDSAVITEKLASKLGIGVGDTVSLQNSDNEYCDFIITGVTENYIYSYLYIAPEQFEAVMGEAPDYQQIIAVSTAQNEEDESRLSDLLLSQDGVNTVRFTSSLSENFDTMIASLDYVIMVIVLFAGLLAFIVLYNLTNINITERQREIATIKVLGFFDTEVGSYVFRETSILTIIGSLLGLVLGVILHHFTITTVEVDMVMFGREVKPLSFILALALTILFAVLVDLVMYRKLKKVSMVESLKSIE